MSVHAFKSPKRSKLTWEDIKKMDLTEVDYEDVVDIDDTDRYDWQQIGTEKYGRSMYCPKTNILRSQTMGEFYGNDTVD